MASEPSPPACRRSGLPIGQDNCRVCGRIANYPAQFVADQVCERCWYEGRPEALRIVERFKEEHRAA